MFDALSTPTKRTLGKLAVGGGIGLFVYDRFERPSAAMIWPLALVGGGLALIALGDARGPSKVSGPQEQADRAAWQAEEKQAKLMPWIVGGAAALTGLLLYARATA